MYTDNDLDRSLARLAAGFAERLADVRHAQARAAAVRARAATPDGLVEVEVTAQGQLAAIRVDPAAEGRLNPQQTARLILELSRQASADAAGQVRSLMAPFLPAGLTPEQDFTAVLSGVPGLAGHGGRRGPR